MKSIQSRVDWGKIHFISENFLNTLDSLNVTSSEHNDYNYIDEERVANYWFKIIGIDDEQDI